MANYAEIADAIADRLKTVSGIGRVADVDEDRGPDWERHPKANSAYWEITFAGQEQEGMTGAGRQTMESLTYTVEGYMPQNTATRSMRAFLVLIDAVATVLRADPTLGSTVHSCELPSMPAPDNGTAAWGDSGREFFCHHIAFELVVKRYVADW